MMVVIACVGVFSCWPWYTFERRRKDIDDLTDLGGALLLHTRRDAVRLIMHHSERYCMTQIETCIVLNNLVGVHARCVYLVTMPLMLNPLMASAHISLGVFVLSSGSSSHSSNLSLSAPFLLMLDQRRKRISSNTMSCGRVTKGSMYCGSRSAKSKISIWSHWRIKR
jgi:hypothetical protein